MSTSKTKAAKIASTPTPPPAPARPTRPTRPARPSRSAAPAAAPGKRTPSRDHAMSDKAKRAPDADEPASPENLDKVRDILFGAQVREQQKRFQRIEERLAKDVSDVRDELLKRLSSLESYFKGEIDTLLEKVKDEQTARNAAVRELTGEVADNAKAADKRAAELDAKVTDAARELRKAILEQSKALRDEINSAHHAATSAADKGLAALRHDKTDRLALADLLTEVSMKLKGEMKMPKGS